MAFMKAAADLPSPSRRLSADEFWELCENRPQIRHCELVAGRIVDMTPAGGEHGAIEINLAFAIKTFLKQKPLGRRDRVRHTP